MIEKLIMDKIQPLSKDFPAVQVERTDKKNFLRITDGLCMIEKGTLITELPNNYKIIDMDDNEVEPTGKFYICVESMDPYYLVLDLPMNYLS